MPLRNGRSGAAAAAGRSALMHRVPHNKLACSNLMEMPIQSVGNASGGAAALGLLGLPQLRDPAVP
jgi:hypothetical protein